jgi:acyl carrier protein
MTQKHEQIRTEVLAIVRRLAPEVDPARIIPDKSLRAQIDLDSHGLAQRAGDHPRDTGGEYSRNRLRQRLWTLDGIVAYLAERIPAAPQE